MNSTSENADIFTARDEIYLVFTEKVNFLFILYSTEIQKAQPNFFHGRFSFDLTFAVCLLAITLGVKHSLHLVNGLESYLRMKPKKSAFKECLLSVP